MKKKEFNLKEVVTKELKSRGILIGVWKHCKDANKKRKLYTVDLFRESEVINFILYHEKNVIKIYQAKFDKDVNFITMELEGDRISKTTFENIGQFSILYSHNKVYGV